MKRFLTFLISLILYSTSNSQVFDWQWLHAQPTGQGINDAIILPNGNYLLFGDYSTVLRSTNSGASWTVSFPDSLNGNRSIYEADFVDGNIGYFCGTGGLLCKTTDGGLTWTQQNSGLTSTLWYIAFYDANTGYALGDAARYLKTTDGGATWNLIPLAAATGVLYNIYIVPNTGGAMLFMGTTSATIGRLARSTDFGATWSPVAGYTSTSSVRSTCFLNADSGFIGNFAHQVWRTTDAGTTFTNVSGAWGTGTMYEVKMISPTVFAAAGNKGDIFVTSDFGNTWDNRNNTYPSNVFSLSIAGNLTEDDPLIITAGEGGSIATSTNLGINWNRLAVLETVNELRGIQFATANIAYAVGGSISTATLAGDILKTTDAGNHWTKLPFDPMYRIKALCCLNENVCFMGSRGPNGLYRTTDGGVTFDSINTGIGLPAYNWNAIGFANSNIGYIVGDDGNYGKTTDGGQTWTLLPASLHHGASIIYDMAVLDVNNVVTLGEAGKVFKTTDGGVSFLNVSNLGTTSAMYGIDFLNSSYGMLVGSSGRAYKTTDGGLTWGLMSTGAGTTTLYGINVVNENIAWISGTNGSIFYTVNGGTSWTESLKSPVPSRTLYEIYSFENNLYTVGGTGTILKGFADPNIPVELTSFTASITDGAVSLNWTTATELNNMGFDIERSSDNMIWNKIGFVAGNGTTTNTNSYYHIDTKPIRGISYYRLGQIDMDGSYEYSPVIRVEINIPLEFSLSQNYPNPFNPVTTIKYSIAAPVQVTLKIFNAIGEEVAVLINETKNPGSYSIDFNADQFSSGVYFYKLEAGEFTSIKKLMLIK